MPEPRSPATDSSWRRLRAVDIVARYTILAAVATRIPCWWATSPAVTALQLKMMADVSEIYGVEFEQDLYRPIAASLAGGALNTVLSLNPLAIALKAWIVTVPVVGIALQLAAGPAAVAAYTYLLGRAFAGHYEAGGSYHDFTAEMVRGEGYRLLGLAPGAAVVPRAWELVTTSGTGAPAGGPKSL